MKLKLLSCLIFVAQVFNAYSQSANVSVVSPDDTYSPSNRPRMAAEWEPAIGVLITWPLSLPHKLVVELAKDTKLYILVETRASQQDAIKWFSKWGILPDRVKFITAPQGIDASWTRDWGPPAVFTHEGTMKLADGKYLYATPVTGLACDDTLQFIYKDDKNQILQTKIDDKIPDYVASSIEIDMVNLPFVFTGGNVISDGQKTAFSTCALSNENKYTGVSDEKFRHDVKQLLGIEQYNFISNFEEHGIQHIDCFMKLLDEERILVMRPPVDHPSYAQYEGIITHELSQLKNAYGRPYQILRIDTDRYRDDELAAYANSLILNQNIYVPLFGIPQDSMALKQWSDAMPGYTVKGFDFVLSREPALQPHAKEIYKGIGWTGGDALHCRTRAIWNPNMIYISVDRLPAKVAKAKEYEIKAILKDYSKGSLDPTMIKVMWRVQGKEEWKESKLTRTQILDQYTATIQGGQAGVTIEYYVTAHSNWGSNQTMPVVAPKGFYQFTID